MTPLKAIRLQRGLSLTEVSTAVHIDSGNLSRIERRQQTPSLELAERLSKFYGAAVTEMQILYPERFMQEGGDV